MDKSYRRNITHKKRRNYHQPNRYRSGMRNSKKPTIFGKILTQILLSIIIVLLIILLKNINTPITNNTSSFLREVMFAEFDYNESLDKTKEYATRLKDYTINTVPVFNRMGKGMNLSRPIDGIVISSYGEKYDPVAEIQTFQRGIDIKSASLRIVKSVDDGTIEKVGESNTLGKFVKITHGDSTFSLYSNLDKIYVKENDKIIRGERIGEIGELSNSYLHFELWINNDAVDPELYIDYSVTGI